MAAGTLTSIALHSEVVKRLRALKTADQTWDDFLTDMAEDYTPPGWFNEMERRRRTGKDVSGSTVIRRSRELAKRGT